MKKNGFLTFCFACVPGCGQMYQGYMRRGASLLLWFFGTIAVSELLGLGVLMFALPVIWAYAFFDTFNIRALTPQQRAQFRDDYIPNAEWLKAHKLSKFRLQGNGNRIAGWVLIGLGIIILLDKLPLYYLYDLPFIGFFFRNFFAILIAVAVILLGLRMLRGGSFKNNAADDIVPFGSAPGTEAPYGYPGQNTPQPPFDMPQAPAAPNPPPAENYSAPQTAPNPFLPDEAQQFPQQEGTAPVFSNYAPGVPLNGSDEIHLTLEKEELPQTDETPQGEDPAPEETPAAQLNDINEDTAPEEDTTHG